MSGERESLKSLGNRRCNTIELSFLSLHYYSTRFDDDGINGIPMYIIIERNESIENGEILSIDPFPSVHNKIIVYIRRKVNSPRNENNINRE